MTIAAKQLADGQLPDTESALYTAPASTTTYVKSIICNNTHASNTNIVYLFLQPSGGTSRRIARVSLDAGDTLYLDESIVLDTGDAIRGYATNASEIDYIISGAEES